MAGRDHSGRRLRESAAVRECALNFPDKMYLLFLEPRTLASKKTRSSL